MPDPGGTIRLDKWLWQARFFKSRGLAARCIGEGRVRVNAVRVTKPAAVVRVGDGLTFVHGGTVRVLRVLALGTRRGPAPEARALYQDLGAGPTAELPASDTALEPGGQAGK
jgi:ribosome-associated heat shock protein Hsp15